jgi:PAS domain S-box-containing protein
MTIRTSRSYVPAIVLLCGLTLSVLLFVSVRAWEQNRALDAFHNYAENQFMIIKTEIDLDLDVLASLKAFYDASEAVTRAEFKAFTSARLTSHKSIQALEWIPRVPLVHRLAYEAKARKDGYAEFRFTERDNRSRTLKAGARAEYFPVYYVEPYKGNEPALGFDLASHAARKKALEKSRDTGGIFATSRIRLVQEKGNQFGFLVFMPIYRKGAPVDSIEARRAALLGFVLGVFRIGDMVEKSLSNLKQGSLDITLYDESAPKHEQFLYRHASGGSSWPVLPPADHVYSKTFDVAGHRWLFMSIRGNLAALTGGGYGSWIVLIAGTLLTTLLATYLHANVNRMKIVQSLVAERSQELEKTNEALSRSEAKYRTIFESMEDVYFETDAQGTVNVLSPSVCRLAGWDPEELMGRPATDLYVDPGDREDLMSVLMRETYVKDYEVCLKRKDGGVLQVSVGAQLLFDKDGRFSGFAGIMRDITKRKTQEEERAKLWSAVERAGEGIFMLTLDGHYSYVNGAFCKAYGFEQEELVGKSTAMTRSDRHPESFHDLVYSELQAGKTWSGRETRRKKDGSHIEVATTIAPVRNEAGTIIHYVGVERDMTEQLQIEQQFRQTQKMEALGTLAGGIAHNFNNMLAIIMGNAELALDDVQATAPRNSLTEILKASERARDLTSQVLAFSRRSEFEKNTMKLTPLLVETYKLLKGTIPATIRVQLDIQTEADTVLADASEIQQVLINLATNAAYAMRNKGGLLTIGLSGVTVRKPHQIPDAELSPGTYVKLTVQDTGTGMTEKVRERIFEPFFTTKGPGHGTGMGLAVAYGTVKNHAGEITVESRVGHGTTFNVFLPLSEAEVTARREQRGEAPSGTERILLVDDEPAVLQAAARTLQRLGYRISTAESGSEAWAKVQEEPLGFDLVITDQVMPDMTGVGLARKILNLRPEMPIILITGFSETVSPKQARDAGIRELIMKPITKREAAEAIRRVLDGKETG